MRKTLLLACLLTAACSLSACDDNEGNATLPEPPGQTEDNNDNQEGMNRLQLTIGGTTLTATLVDNTSTQALIQLLSQGSVTIHMRDYANMEKVGPLGATLPRNDQYITTSAGDLILYQGNQFVIYYSDNAYSLTRLGKIDHVSADSLRQVLGRGDVTVTLSLPGTAE